MRLSAILPLLLLLPLRRLDRRAPAPAPAPAAAA